MELDNFLSVFYPKEDEVMHFRAFSPRNAESMPPLSFNYSRRELKENGTLPKKMLEANEKLGFYFCPNFSDALKAGSYYHLKDADITSLRAWFLENDTFTISQQHQRLDSAPLKPSIRVETRKSVHAYYLIDADCSLDDWEEIQLRLIEFFDGDKNIKNPSRVMRVPFFNHLSCDKNGYSYQSVNVVAFHPERRYDVSEMMNAFPPVPKKEVTRKTEFSSDEDMFGGRYAALKNYIATSGRLNRNGIYEMRGVCHNGKGRTALCFNTQNGNVWCSNDCKPDDICNALGLPIRRESVKVQRSMGAAQTALSTPSKLGLTWGELLNQKYTESEKDKILFGVMRGQVGLMVSPTNIGKTTLSLNLALSLASGKSFSPFINESGLRRVMFIDGESTRPELQTDLNVMTSRLNQYENELISKNLLILCDEEIEDESLDLTNPRHLKIIEERAKDFEPDLIVIDTLAAVFNLERENDNSEAKIKVFTPLKALARSLGCAVWLNHHTGKQSEERGSGGAYSGRGASNFGALARSVITLTPNKLKGVVELSLAKSKGLKLQNQDLLLNENDRWFEIVGETPKTPSCTDAIVNFAHIENRELATKDFLEKFEGVYSERSIKEALQNALRSERLDRIKHGVYIESAGNAAIKDTRTSALSLEKTRIDTNTEIRQYGKAEIEPIVGIPFYSSDILDSEFLDYESAPFISISNPIVSDDLSSISFAYDEAAFVEIIQNGRKFNFETTHFEYDNEGQSNKVWRFFNQNILDSEKVNFGHDNFKECHQFFESLSSDTEPNFLQFYDDQAWEHPKSLS
jgi:RecA-family ATPase